MNAPTYSISGQVAAQASTESATSNNPLAAARTVADVLAHSHVEPVLQELDDITWKLGTTKISVRNLNQDTITQAVIARFAQTPDPRLKEIMTSLVQHLHAFAREVRLTESEWLQGIEFLTATGQKCDDKRQEFILLSDTLGLSMLTVAMNNDKPQACTEATAWCGD